MRALRSAYRAACAGRHSADKSVRNGQNLARVKNTWLIRAGQGRRLARHADVHCHERPALEHDHDVREVKPDDVA